MREKVRVRLLNKLRPRFMGKKVAFARRYVDGPVVLLKRKVKVFEVGLNVDEVEGVRRL